MNLQGGTTDRKSAPHCQKMWPFWSVRFYHPILMRILIIIIKEKGMFMMKTPTFDSIEPTTTLYAVVILMQTLFIATANFMLDHYFRNRYRKRGGKEGAAPPMLEVNQDVLDHEQEVKANKNLS